MNEFESARLDVLMFCLYSAKILLVLPRSSAEYGCVSGVLLQVVFFLV